MLNDYGNEVNISFIRSFHGLLSGTIDERTKNRLNKEFRLDEAAQCSFFVAKSRGRESAYKTTRQNV
jgi:hypothetical protein